MSFYSSFFRPRSEKVYWRATTAVVLVIFTSLFIPQTWQRLLWNQQLQFYLFLSGLLLTALALLMYAISAPKGKELAFWVALSAVGLMLIFRLGAPERSHLIEYCSLTLCLHRALGLRWNGKPRLWIALATGFIALAIGILDEVLQAFLPQRVFALEDIVFNSLAVFTTLTLQALGDWVKGLRS